MTPRTSRASSSSPLSRRLNRSAGGPSLHQIHPKVVVRDEGKTFVERRVPWVSSRARLANKSPCDCSFVFIYHEYRSQERLVRVRESTCDRSRSFSTSGNTVLRALHAASWYGSLGILGAGANRNDVSDIRYIAHRRGSGSRSDWIALVRKLDEIGCTRFENVLSVETQIARDVPKISQTQSVMTLTVHPTCTSAGPVQATA